MAPILEGRRRGRKKKRTRSGSCVCSFVRSVGLAGERVVGTEERAWKKFDLVGQKRRANPLDGRLEDRQRALGRWNRWALAAGRSLRSARLGGEARQKADGYRSRFCRPVMHDFASAGPKWCEKLKYGYKEMNVRRKSAAGRRFPGGIWTMATSAGGVKRRVLG